MKYRSRNSTLTAVFFLSAILWGCGDSAENASVMAPPQRIQPTPVKMEAAQPATKDVPQGTLSGFAYDSGGRRDPFEPLLMIKKPVSKSDFPLTPLQTHELTQLRLIGVVVGSGSPRAMVAAPDGKAYIIKVGVRIGKNNGLVRSIKNDAVLVDEQFTDLAGETKTVTQEIRLPKREGVL